ncbi:MAG: hypothetical protein A2163_08405 [Actinobacteria bacterium RBG_13_35_12]|nr:MAG: hypothetical protein A2163_08405 [Actinobacteria bacterium RBG_13_35_12]OGD35003.1 MAG: hypothetical protein A2V94_08635 [Candidatus Atribacteria bacterium RBG_16_35_8]
MIVKYLVLICFSFKVFFYKYGLAILFLRSGAGGIDNFIVSLEMAMKRVGREDKSDIARLEPNVLKVKVIKIDFILKIHYSRISSRISRRKKSI